MRPAASQDVFTRMGRLGVPTIVIEERVVVDFNAHRVEIEALARDREPQRRVVGHFGPRY